jgi:large subunit ribosomal protein L31
MKDGIHPEYNKVEITCVCGNVIEAGSTQKVIKVEICNNCHPLYTGQQKVLDAEGRIEKFKKRYENKK